MIAKKFRLAQTFVLGLMLTFFVLPDALVAQGQNQEVTIIAPYQPTISEAFKMASTPKNMDTVIEVPPMDYFINSHPIQTSYDIQSVNPVMIDVDPERSMNRNYLKAGYGNYNMPYVELYSNSLQSDEFSLGFYARHLSSTGNIEDYAPADFSQNDVALFGERYLKEKVLKLKLYFDRDVVHYYGFKPVDYADLDLSAEDLKQRFATVGGSVSLASNYRRNNKINYLAALDFYNQNDLFESNESMLRVFTNLNSKNEFFDFVEKQESGIDVSVDYFNNSDSLDDQNTVAVRVKPYLHLNMEYLDLSLGVEGALAADSSTNFYIYPEVKLSYQVIPDFLRFYASFTGGLQRNSFRSITTENPWANSIFPMLFTNTKYDVRGGATGNINELFNFDFSVSWVDVENMLFYLNDFDSPFSPIIQQNLGNKFTGVYDDVKLTTVQLQLAFEQSEQMDLFFTARYSDYKMTTQAKPWHKPALEVSLAARYFFSEKVSFNGELFFNSKVYAQTFQNNEYRIAERDAYVDLSLGAEYKFNDKISAFAKLNNITSTRYFRWYNYPSQRINALAGLTFSF